MDINGKITMATHPKMPNLSGHARGRKVHITLDGLKTKCNMLVDPVEYSHIYCVVNAKHALKNLKFNHNINKQKHETFSS